MNKEEAILFLFSIAQEIKRAFEAPVILMTMKDYAENVINIMVEIRSALSLNATPDRVVDIIREFHLNWLQAVEEIENFKRHIKDTPRDSVVFHSIEYTIDSALKRKVFFEKYIESLENTLTLDDMNVLKTDLEAITDMNVNLKSALREKQTAMRNIVDQNEYFYKVLDETEELLNWLDTLNDNLAIQLSRFVGVRFPTTFAADLTKTLQQVIDEVAGSTSQDMFELVNEMKLQSDFISSTIRIHSGDEVEIKKIVDKIKELENRIELLKRENSSAVPALQHKAMFLEERLQTIENLKMSVCALKNKKYKTTDKSKAETHIFDHLLPTEERARLVDELIKLWNDAIISGQDKKSIISILSVADMKETFVDEWGKFVIDKYGRKLYTSLKDDASLYQMNEKNQLVPVSDDDKHVYFYDDCGRYYLNSSNTRVYKAHKEASEYIFNYDDLLVKVKEVRNGIAYFYDNLGRFYINRHGQQIYLDEDGDEYEHDGLGNLVKIRDPSKTNYVTCPRETSTIEETKYLQQTVGVALKKCIANVILHQPLDPVLFLAQSLENYRFRERELQRLREDEVEMMAERKERMRDLESVPAFPCPEGESGEIDYNLIKYNTPLL